MEDTDAKRISVSPCNSHEKCLCRCSGEILNRDPKGEKHDWSYIHQRKDTPTLKAIRIYIYTHTQCLVHSTQPNINGTRLSRERRDVRAHVGLSALLRTSTPGLPYGACIPCWSCILPGLVKPDWGPLAPVFLTAETVDRLTRQRIHLKLKIGWSEFLWKVL